MSIKPDVPTEIAKNTLPYHLIGKSFFKRFGISPGFLVVKKQLYFQPHIFFQCVDTNSEKVLAEFRTVTTFKCDKIFEKLGFYELNYSFIEAAIKDFDREFKKLKSTLTVNERYSPYPSFEECKLAIRKSYMLAGFRLPSNN